MDEETMMQMTADIEDAVQKYGWHILTLSLVRPDQELIWIVGGDGEEAAGTLTYGGRR